MLRVQDPHALATIHVQPVAKAYRLGHRRLGLPPTAAPSGSANPNNPRRQYGPMARRVLLAMIAIVSAVTSVEPRLHLEF